MRSTTNTGAGMSPGFGRSWMLLGLLAVGGILAGCGAGTSSAASNGSAGAATDGTESDSTAVLATIDGKDITMKDIRDRAGDNLDRMDIGYRNARSQLIGNTLDQILNERVLLAEARKEGKSVEELIAAEAGRSLDPTDSDVSTWYDENKARLGGRTLDELKPQIASYLRTQRHDAASERLQQRLEKERKVTVYFEPYRVPLNNEGAPALGPADAAVTMTEFSDFQCPYCGRFFTTLKQLEKNFGDDLRVVYRQFPLNIHPNAEKAAEASLCAQDQGKFWEMHDLMFQEQNKLGVQDLKEKAARLGLDQKEFDDCLDSGKHVARIRADEQEGARVGVEGTPAFFLNGVPLPGGAVPYDVAAKAIQEAVDRAKQRSSGGE
jgi:protein-disulfide isomerase